MPVSLNTPLHGITSQASPNIDACRSVAYLNALPDRPARALLNEVSLTLLTFTPTDPHNVSRRSLRSFNYLPRFDPAQIHRAKL